MPPSYVKAYLKRSNHQQAGHVAEPAAAALCHHLWRRDTVLLSMLPGR